MTDKIQIELPDGVPVSYDTGTPSATPGTGFAEALEALEFARVLDNVAAHAAGPLGAARILAREPSSDATWIREELIRVAELVGLLREGRGVVAEPVPDVADALVRLRIAGSVLDGAELLGLRRTLTAARLVLAELRRIAADAPHVAALELPAPEKTLERRLEQALDDDGTVRDGASAGLAAARSDIRTARERLVQKLEATLRGLGGDGGVTVRDGRYVIPVPRDLRSRPDGIVHGESASGSTLYVEPAAAIALGNAMREAEARAAREELIVLRSLTNLLRPLQAELGALHEMCVVLDDLQARAKWAVEVDGHAPAVAGAPADFRIVNGRHPLLLAADRGEAGTVVPFDLALEEGERCVLLSGPNTGGKSVLLKAVGLTVALTQSGIVPPLGPGSALPIFKRIFADIGDRQSITANLSTFSAHLALLRLILDEADDRSLILLDEIGSGTDPAEGGALAGATLQALTRRGAITIATTHLGALKRLATSTPGVVNASLQFDAATLQPTYRLVKGVPGRSYGLAIARRLGVRPDVLEAAEAQVPEAERSLDALLAAVEHRQREQEALAVELTGRLEAVEARSRSLAEQAEAQGLREAALRRQERDAERAGREQARQYLLAARAQVEAAVARAAETSDEAAREARRLVEQAAAQEAGALQRLAGSERAGAPGAAGLDAGTPVRMASGTVGEVLEVRGDGRVVLRVGSLRLVADPGSLTPLGPGERPGRPAHRSDAHGGVAETAASYEVDLRGMTGDEAEQVVVAALDSAILAEQPYLRIIHGKGTGVVRERVQQVLRRDRRVKSHAFAASNQGGTGVTVAELAG
jgi:DNA mismatch repair protein MutS2